VLEKRKSPCSSGESNQVPVSPSNKSLNTFVTKKMVMMMYCNGTGVRGESAVQQGKKVKVKLGKVHPRRGYKRPPGG
jgi:hypothetical protein